MIALIKKEFNSFFSTPIAYFIIGVFLTVNGLFLWIFDNDFNILNAGFADINSFFYLSPWLLLFLVPAVTMKSFSDEYQTGTIEILLTKPLSISKIIWGKFLACVILIIIAILPTLVYVYSVYELGNSIGNIDLGSTMASYFGLSLLACVYASIGLFCSLTAKNQLVAFLMSTTISFFLFYGFEAMANLFGNQSYTVKNLGFYHHYQSMSRGVIDSRDFLYFVSVTLFFLIISYKKLSDD